MAFRILLAYCGIFLCSLLLCFVDGSMWHGCDNGKLLLERDLPPPSMCRCPGPSWPESNQKLSSIDTKYPTQPAKPVCMDTPITYNHTIPNSGAHRPVGAESGEYLYCPPQRWVHNLQHGATVFLYHPCASLSQRALLSVLAHSCLSHYIITPFHQLSTNRPLALVSLGRTLEVSHVTVLEVCNWLELNAADSIKSTMQQRGKYSLLLTRTAGAYWLKDTVQKGTHKQLAVKRQQSLKSCCVETLSTFLEGGTEMDLSRMKKNRRRRAILKTGLGEKGKDTKEMDKDNVSTEMPSSSVKVFDGRAPQSTGPDEFQKFNPTHWQDLNNVRESKPIETTTGRGETDKNQAVGLQKRETNVVEKDGKAELREQKNEGKETEGTKKTFGVSPTQKTTDVKKIHILEVQEKQERRDTLRELQSTGEEGHKGEAHTNTQHHRKNGQANLKQQTEANGHKPGNDKGTDHDGPGHCACTEMAEPAGAAVIGQRLPTPRTDEAVWAAAALGFLLVLLALSVLHTRLYQHWRTAPSLYWHDPQQDYDSVADVIHRRLKMVGRRKRRPSQSRRKECVLLPSSSTDDESE
ncbi:hypothetical protein MATL_G00115760 [Megalops atlanticus]|uniref:Tumor protein p53-inducible protein 13 n=1 Tax=Megalops atlanticus TaxID=7932 RepID=A0A9D3PWS8_MEGAT|nr:hypothetical protein MATL_G00115760 [Megalops atlanticus]